MIIAVTDMTRFVHDRENNFMVFKHVYWHVVAFSSSPATRGNSSGASPSWAVVLFAAPWKRSKWDVALMVYVFICCTMAHSDLMPRFVREEYMKPYGLKALPVILVWFKLCYEIITKAYKPIAQKA